MPEKPKDSIFKTEGLFHQENDLPSIHIYIQLTEDYLIVIEAENMKIKSIANLKDLRYVIINED